jgi:hypothetical protein
VGSVGCRALGEHPDLAGVAGAGRDVTHAMSMTKANCTTGNYFDEVGTVDKAA